MIHHLEASGPCERILHYMYWSAREIYMYIVECMLSLYSLSCITCLTAWCSGVVVSLVSLVSPPGGWCTLESDHNYARVKVVVSNDRYPNSCRHDALYSLWQKEKPFSANLNSRQRNFENTFPVCLYNSIWKHTDVKINFYSYTQIPI